MKHSIFNLTILLLFVMSCQMGFSQVTQEWVKMYNGREYFEDEVKSMAIDNSGNVYVTGRSYGFGNNYDYATIKYNPNGTQEWVQRYSSGISVAKDIVVDDSGNVYVTGETWGATYIDYLTIKYNSNGDTLWVRKYSGPGVHQDIANSIAVDKLGNVYVTGSCQYGGSVGSIDYATIKYNSNGDSLWVRRYNGPYGQDEATSLSVDNSGNVYVTGASEGAVTGTFDYATVKYNSSGIEQWVKRYNGPANNTDIAYKIAIDNSGNVYITGVSNGINTDFATIKYNSNGDSVWVKRYNGPANGFESAKSIVIDNSENVYVTGYSSGVGSRTDFATIKYNSNGDSVWVKRYNGPTNQNDRPTSITLDNSGNIYVAGSSKITGNNYEYVAIKYNSSGVQEWIQTYFGAEIATIDPAAYIKIDNANNFYLAVTRRGIGTGLDYTTIKYSQQSTKTLQLTSLLEGLYDIKSNKMVKDTARVYLRNTSSPYSIVDSSKSVLDSNGNGTFTFSNAANGSPYYIIVRHRNSINTWSSSGQSFTSNTMSYDFTTSADKAYGDNLIQKGSRFCIFSGDVNHDGSINLNDVIAINNDLVNFVTGYNPTDLNGDEQSDLADLVIAHNNSLNFITAEFPGSLDNSQSNIENKSVQSNKFELRDNYPNPFNPSTVISYELRVTNYVSLKVFDIIGKEVATLVNENQNAGTHSVTFDASHLSSGTYFYRLESAGNVIVKRMLLVK